MNHNHLVGTPDTKQFKRFFIQEGVGLVGLTAKRSYTIY